MAECGSEVSLICERIQKLGASARKTRVHLFMKYGRMSEEDALKELALMDEKIAKPILIY